MTDTATINPVLAAHFATRAARVSEKFPEIKHEHYIEVVLKQRSERYAAHVASMIIDPSLVQWGLSMTRQFGPYVLAWHYVADWFTALLILRYGEENRAYDEAEVEAAKSEEREPNCSTDPNYTGWPLAFSEEDIKRASELLSMERWPAKVFTLLSKEG